MLVSNIFNSLRRVTSKGDFIPEIDGLRLLALLPVIIKHFDTNYTRTFDKNNDVSLGILDTVIKNGNTGVFIFFAISGFILSYAFARHFYVNKKSFNELNLKGYFWRRLTRLEPPFLISTLAFYFLTGLVITHSFTSIIPNLLATLTYSHYLFFGKWSVINPVTWTLEVEVQFYLMAPFICALFFTMKEWPRNLLLIFLIASFPFIVYYSPDSIFMKGRLGTTVPVYMCHFLVVILLASLYTGSLWHKIKKGQYLFDIVFLVALVAMFNFHPIKQELGNYIIYDIGLILIMIASFKGKIINAFFTNPIVTTIGGMCYSIYLLHYALLFGLLKVTKFIKLPFPYLNYGFHFVISITFVLVVSSLFFKYCEKPFMYKDWPQRFMNFIKGKPKLTIASSVAEKDHSIK